ncbi:hypothetical protein H2198_008012 [Neophaeococcomyces mojaviensis]|uniref:Uncharacterized protein n=1 Tax=Neophaeococcomyces mojaviensis TaxID=3383035 RepID=A0ACC2ZYH6_9EURO|nr:hypothetical protein H2198_008012 [Knufia sp. JES_112]
MTELTCSVMGWDINKTADSNSVGELNANCEAMIMDEDGLNEITERGPQACGEIWVRCPNMMKGYWKNPKATAQIMSHNGWLKTGDIAYIDDAGHFFIVDRIKELIKVKGNQVAPAELEALLLEHPAPRAFVVRQPDVASQKTTKDDLIRFVESKVIRYKRLAGGVEWVTAIPKNPSGKILRRQLRNSMKQGMSTVPAKL